MTQTDELTRKIRTALAGEPYGLEAKQIAQKLDGDATSHGVSNRCKSDPFIAEMEGARFRYRLRTEKEMRELVEEYDDFIKTHQEKSE